MEINFNSIFLLVVGILTGFYGLGTLFFGCINELGLRYLFFTISLVLLSLSTIAFYLYFDNYY